jgi:hypothetical protein
MDNMVRLFSPHLDDPLIVVSMYMQLQHQLFSDSCGRLMPYVGELERASEAVRGASDGIQRVANSLFGFCLRHQCEGICGSR